MRDKQHNKPRVAQSSDSEITNIRTTVIPLHVCLQNY